MKNRGTSFEKFLNALFSQYRRQGKARIEKVDPPSISTGKKTVLLPNPWLDYAGTWTEENGRSIILEAKHTEKPTLAISRAGGLTERQWRELNEWSRYGAAAAVLWRYQERIKVLTPEIIRRLLDAKQRVSLQWHDLPASISGPGFARDDVLATLMAFDLALKGGHN